MTCAFGVDLDRWSARGAYALRVKIGLKVSFNDADSQSARQVEDRSSKDRGLPRAWRGDHVQTELLALGQKLAVLHRVLFIGAEDSFAYADSIHHLFLLELDLFQNQGRVG